LVPWINLKNSVYLKSQVDCPIFDVHWVQGLLFFGGLSSNSALVGVLWARRWPWGLLTDCSSLAAVKQHPPPTKVKAKKSVSMPAGGCFSRLLLFALHFHHSTTQPPTSPPIHPHSNTSNLCCCFFWGRWRQFIDIGR